MKDYLSDDECLRLLFENVRHFKLPSLHNRETWCPGVITLWVLRRWIELFRRTMPTVGNLAAATLQNDEDVRLAREYLLSSGIVVPITNNPDRAYYVDFQVLQDKMQEAIDQQIAADAIKALKRKCRSKKGKERQSRKKRYDAKPHRWTRYDVSSLLDVLPLPGVYAIYGDGRLIYIGSSTAVGSRLTAHLKATDRLCTPWGKFSVVIVKVRYERKHYDWLMLERRLIERLNPPGNKAGKGTSNGQSQEAPVDTWAKRNKLQPGVGA